MSNTFIESSVDNEKSIIHIIPNKSIKVIPMEEYIDLLCKIPKGKIVRGVDIEAYFAKKYNVDLIEIEDKVFYENPMWEEIPYWRVVATRGFLQEFRPLSSKEYQKSKLEQEGLAIISCGTKGISFKVENYKKYLYDLNSV